MDVFSNVQLCEYVTHRWGIIAGVKNLILRWLTSPYCYPSKHQPKNLLSKTAVSLLILGNWACIEALISSVQE